MPRPKGLPKTGGRKPGTPNKNLSAAQAENERLRAALAGVQSDRPLTALELLQRIYRDEQIDLSTRMAAAGKAINYESPALAATRLDAGEGLQRVAQILSAAAQGFDEKINGVIAAKSGAAEDAAGDTQH